MNTQAWHSESNILKGLGLSLLAYFMVSLLGLSEKMLPNHLPIISILFFQNIVSFSLLLPQFLRSGVGLKTNFPTLYALRIFFGLSCFATLFFLIRHIPMSEAILFQYSAALWIPIIGFFWLRVRIQPSIAAAILVGFLGILLILGSLSTLPHDVFLLAILCGVLQALSVTSIRQLSVIDDVNRVLFYYFAVGTLVTLPYVLLHWQHLSPESYLLLFLIGIFTYGTQQLIARALQYMHANTLAPITYTAVLFSAVLDYSIWHEHITLLAAAGMLLVIGAGLFTLPNNRP